MSNLDYYLITLLFYGVVSVIEVVGFNMQFGQVGVLNLAYIVLVAIGAYATGIASLPPSSKLHIAGVTYIGGFNWGFPFNMLFGIAVTVFAALLLAAVAFRRIRYDYLALVLVAIGEATLLLATNDTSLVNGLSGILNVPTPFHEQLSTGSQELILGGFGLICATVIIVLFWRVCKSPLGRLLKAVREDELLLESFGKNSVLLKMTGFLLGAAAAGVAGSLLVLFIGGWSTGGWQPGESFIILAALILGGRGRISGAILGAIVLMELFLQGVSLINIPFLSTTTLPIVQQLIIAIVILAVLWWRPAGLLPEQKERFRYRA